MTLDDLVVPDTAASAAALEVASAYTLIFFVMIIPLLVAMQMFAETGRPR